MSGHDVDMQWSEKNFHNGLNVLDCDFKVFSEIVSMAQCRMRTVVPCLLCVLRREWMLILADVILAQRSYSESPGAKAFAKETKHQSFICNEIQNQTERLFKIFRKRVNEKVKVKPMNSTLGEDQSCRRCLNVSMMDAAGEVLLRHFKPDLLRFFEESDQADCLEEASQYYRDLILSDLKVKRVKSKSKKQVRREKKRANKENLQPIESVLSELSMKSRSAADSESEGKISLSESDDEDDKFFELDFPADQTAEEKELILGSMMLYRWDMRIVVESAKYHKKRGPRFAVSYAAAAENFDLNAEIESAIRLVFLKYVCKKRNVKNKVKKPNVVETFDLMASLRKIKTLAKSQVNSGCPCCHLTEMLNVAIRSMTSTYAEMMESSKNISLDDRRTYLIRLYRCLLRLQLATCTISQELLKEYHEDGPWTVMDLCYACTTENGLKIFRDVVIFSPTDFVQDLSKRIQQSCFKKALKSSYLDNH